VLHKQQTNMQNIIFELFVIKQRIFSHNKSNSL
jgi:hypothetical protein